MSSPKPIRQAARALADSVMWTFDLRRWHIFLRKRSKAGFNRSWGSLIPVFQAATASALAYFIAETALHHPTPVFAAITAWLCLGFSRNRRPRQVAEMGAGVSIGVLFGELFGAYLGIGVWQIFAILIVAPLVARFLDRGDLFTVQAAINSVTILGLVVIGGAEVQARWGDAIIGALLAFAFAVILPRNVTSRPRRYLRAVLYELADTLELAANGLGWGDVEVLYDAQASMRSVQHTLHDGHRALRTAVEVTRYNRSLRLDREIVGELQRIFTLLDRTEASALALLRVGSGAVTESGPKARAGEIALLAAEVLRQFAAAVQIWEEPTRARELALELAALCRPTEDWRESSLITVLRAISIDLLQMTGLTRAEARSALPHTGQAETAEEEDPELGDESDTIWALRDEDAPNV